MEIGPPVHAKIFLKVLTIYGRGDHLCHVTWTIYTNFDYPSQGGCTLNLASIGGAASEMFEMVDDDNNDDNDGRRSMRY